MNRPVTTAAAILLGAMTVSAFAQVPLGSEFRVTITASAGSSSGSDVTVVPGGDFVVAWTSAQPYVSDIAGRRFHAGGLPAGPEFLVNTHTTGGWQLDPSIASDDLGNFVVVWTSGGQDGSGDGVFGQRFAASGNRLGAEFRVNETTVGHQLQPMVAMRGSGAFAVVWTEFGGVGGGIRGRRFDSAGAPVAGEFQVNMVTTGANPSVAFDASGGFVVAWQAFPIPPGIRARLFDVAGTPQGPDFAVNIGSYGGGPRVARNASGEFVVAWYGPRVEDSSSIVARRFAPTGAPLSGEIAVNVHTTALQYRPVVAIDADGDFVVAWESRYQDGSGYGIFARRFAATGASGPEFRVNTYTTFSQDYPAIAGDDAGNFVVTWSSSQYQVPSTIGQRFAGGLSPAALVVDAAITPTSDGNGVLEAGETVRVAPSWLNADFSARTFAGTASSLGGPGSPGDPTYTIMDGTAAYGTAPSGATGSCEATGDCYGVGVTVPTARPAAHWDATFREDLAPAGLGLKTWRLHLGDSFADVPRSNPYYRFIEALLHTSVTGGCAATDYCPAQPTSRAQMAVFVLMAKEGAGYVPEPCPFAPFSDVDATDPFCRWIIELVRRGVVAGCGSNNFCPTAPVAREQMAVFVLATKERGVVPPACGVPMFNDVPASSPYCRWIEELARRGVVTGCGGGAYCPTLAVTREQMSVFLTVTFGLALYGP